MKKKIITVLLTIVLIVPFFMISPKAAYDNSSSTTVTSYGQYYTQYGYNTSTYQLAVGFELSLTITSGSYTSFTYQFKDTYDGFINFTLTANKAFAWNDCLFYVDGGVFTQQPNMTNSSATKSFQISFQSSDGFTIYIVKDEGLTTPSQGTFYTATWSITGQNFNLQPNVADDLYYLRGRWDYYVPGMSTSLSNISSALYDGSGVSWLSTISSDLSTLKGYTDGLEGYVDDLENLLRALEVSTVINIEPYQWSSWVWCSKKNSSFPQFKYNLPYLSYDLSTNNASFTQSNGIRLSQGQSYALVFYSNVYISASNFNVYLQNSNQSVDISFGRVNEVVAGLYAQIITISNTYAGFTYFEPEFTASGLELYPIYFGNTISIPDDVLRLVGLDYDNTYTRLLTSINNGIGVLNGDYDTSTYDSYEQTLDGLNDDLRGRFNASNNNFQQSVNTIFSNSAPAGATPVNIFTKFHFSSVNSAFNIILNRILNIAPFLRYILLFGLVLLVVGVFI